jgi:head-tail adaptor
MTLAELTSIHTIEIQEETVTRGPAGSAVRVWSAVDGAPTGARAVPLTTAEIMEFDRYGMRVDTKFFFSIDPSMNEKKRILFESRIYEFAGATEWDYLNRGWTVHTVFRSNLPDNI